MDQFFSPRQPPLPIQTLQNQHCEEEVLHLENVEESEKVVTKEAEKKLTNRLRINTSQKSEKSEKKINVKDMVKKIENKKQHNFKK
jgi:hypothetical protein